MLASDFLITTNADYQNPGARGLEVGDFVTKTGSQQITVDWGASTPGDYVRVLTLFSQGGVEICDGIDNDGDGDVDEGLNCPRLVVGGELFPLDTTMVLVAGTHTVAAWMIPVIVSGIGFAIVIARKF